MQPSSDFWETLDRLAHALEKEGNDDVRRSENISRVLETFPKTRRDECLAKLSVVSVSLPVIVELCQKRAGESG
jgi:hypothetical protein